MDDGRVDSWDKGNGWSSNFGGCLPFFSSECWDDECNVFDWEGVDCMEIIELVSEGIVVGDFLVVETLCGVGILQAGSQMNVILS